MPDTIPATYYLDRKKNYLRDFDRIVKPARAVFADHFDPDEIQIMVEEMRQKFEELLPQIPYVGGEQPFTGFLVFTAMSLAYYRVCSAHGKTLEQTGEILFEVGRVFLQTTPKFLMRFFSPRNFSPRYLKKLPERAAKTQERQYPGNYVISFVEGDGVSFDYGIDYLECGGCKFLESQGAFELARYICPIDIVYSEALGWGLTRTQTIADGGDICDFRFKQGGPTRVAVPDAMKEVVLRAL